MVVAHNTEVVSIQQSPTVWDSAHGAGPQCEGKFHCFFQRHVH